jgi:hypothetical protein
MTSFRIKTKTQESGPLPLAFGTHTVGSAPDATIRIDTLPPLAFGILLSDTGAIVTGAVSLVVGGVGLAPGVARYLRHGEPISLGQVVFTLDEEIPPPKDTRSFAREILFAARRNRASRSLPRVTWLTGMDLGKSLNLFHESTLIGRGSRCAIRLRDGFASREHARIVLVGSTASLLDLKSANGVEVNGREIIGATRLKGGEVLLIGGTLLGFDAGARRRSSRERTTSGAVKRRRPKPPPLPTHADVTLPGSPFPETGEPSWR